MAGFYSWHTAQLLQPSISSALTHQFMIIPYSHIYISICRPAQFPCSLCPSLWAPEDSDVPAIADPPSPDGPCIYRLFNEAFKNSNGREIGFSHENHWPVSINIPGNYSVVGQVTCGLFYCGTSVVVKLNSDQHSWWKNCHWKLWNWWPLL